MMNVHESQEEDEERDGMSLFSKFDRLIAKESKTNTWNQKLRKADVLVAFSSIGEFQLVKHD